MDHSPLLGLQAEAIWLSQARRSKANVVKHTAGPERSHGRIVAEDLKQEALALRRAHRAVRGPHSPPRNLTGQTSSSQPGQEGLASENLEEPVAEMEETAGRCPVCGGGRAGADSHGRTEELKAQLEVVEDLLEKSRSEANEAAALRRRLSAVESRAAEMEVASCMVLRLCQELFVALELQSADFQRYVDTIRRQIGPFLEQAALFEAGRIDCLQYFQPKSARVSASDAKQQLTG
ncbi:unnamed protein product [Symbiodinium natans]|uniref:Uncharacterized protein n=1 Tax=Symbiodinium natans TaxID=878477 RepID=A0A812KS23_9DINO|nr:unnamed protein product [Symbiodinium natans]